MESSNTTTCLDTDVFSYPGSGLWISVFSVIIIVTILGNVLTIIAITISRQLYSIIANQFIFSLAISDLIVGLSIPYHMCFYLFETFGHEQYQCIIRFILLSFACSNSICKLLTIATDRYIAIIYPLRYNRYMTRRVAWILIIAGWIFSLALATIPIYWNKWHEGIFCETETVLPRTYFGFILTPMFGMVWVIMLLLYVKIWREAYCHAKRVTRTTRPYQKPPITNSKSLQVVMLTLGCFSLCWMPYFIVTIYYIATETSSKCSMIYEIAFTMAVANSGMNPVIYAWKNSNFRQAFWCLLTCHSPNNATKNINYITNHVPSKKNSMANGTERGHDNPAVHNEIDVEMDSQNNKDYDEHECSVSTEMTNVNTSGWT